MAARRSETKVTTDHNEIRRLVESKGGCPARVKSTGRGNDPGILRIDYPGFRGVDTLVRMSWNDWFDAFDRNELALVYQPSTRLSKLVSRDTVTARASTRATPRRATGAKRAATKTAAKQTATKRAGSKHTAADRAASKQTATKRATSKRNGAKKPAARKALARRGATDSRGRPKTKGPSATRRTATSRA